MAMERLRNMAVLERRYDTSMVGAGRVVCTVAPTVAEFIWSCVVEFSVCCVAGTTRIFFKVLMYNRVGWYNE